MIYLKKLPPNPKFLTFNRTSNPTFLKMVVLEFPSEKFLPKVKNLFLPIYHIFEGLLAQSTKLDNILFLLPLQTNRHSPDSLANQDKQPPTLPIILGKNSLYQANKSDQFPEGLYFRRTDYHKNG